MNKTLRIWTVLYSILTIFGLTVQNSQAAQFKVLVAMSYSEQMLWEQQVRKGIEEALSGNCELRFFYMHTKADLAGGLQKAKQLFGIYQSFQPDGVIAVDDNAQSMFVVPYLKDKVKTPVMFCGVNAKPDKYGYPASNVSGMLERYHIGESLAFAKQLVPSMQTFGYIVKDSPTGKAALEQILREADNYPLKFVGHRMPKTLQETETMVVELKQKCDVLFNYTMDGILDKDGKGLKDSTVMPMVVKTFGKPVIGGSAYNIKFGRLCGVVKTGEEQGMTASGMLLKAMQGTPMAQIPIVQNKSGKRMINVTVMTELGIQPRPVVLRGAELVRAQK